MSECTECPFKRQFLEFIDRIRKSDIKANKSLKERIVINTLENIDYKAIVKYRLGNIRYYGEVVKFKSIPRILSYVFKILNTEDGSVKKYGYSIGWHFIQQIDARTRNICNTGVYEDSMSELIEDIWILVKNLMEFKYENTTMFNVNNESKFKEFIEKIENEHFGDHIAHIN